MVHGDGLLTDLSPDGMCPFRRSPLRVRSCCDEELATVWYEADVPWPVVQAARAVVASICALQLNEETAHGIPDRNGVLERRVSADSM